MTVVLATADFALYHGVVTELRDRGVRFTTVEPGGSLPAETAVVIVGADDDLGATAEGLERVVADPDDPRGAVDAALAAGDPVGRRIVGVDPGDRPGVAVLDGEAVVAAFHVPLAEAVDVIQREAEAGLDPVVRIGDGARLRGANLIEELDDVRVELVDESGTTPHLGTGARGMGDVLAAINIARRPGEPIRERVIEPTAGEIQRIKVASRERSASNRTITAALARRVAAGELSLEEALDEHRAG